jgi:hypothetical protein
MIRLIESNATFDGERLTPIYDEPFDALAEGLKDQTGEPDETRTPWRPFVLWLEQRTPKRTSATVFVLAT